MSDRSLITFVWWFAIFIGAMLAVHACQEDAHAEEVCRQPCRPHEEPKDDQCCFVPPELGDVLGGQDTEAGQRARDRFDPFLTSEGSALYKIQLIEEPPEASWQIVIHYDGRVELIGVEPDEGAKIWWDAIEAEGLRRHRRFCDEP